MIRSTVLAVAFGFISMLLGCAASRPKSAEEPITRDYQAIESRISALKNVEKEVIGWATSNGKKYPIYLITIPHSKGALKGTVKNVFLSGGVHGDEPAGIFALLDWIEKESARYSKNFNFYILPCLNPTGFEQNTLETAQGKNINRSFFEKSPSAEATTVMSVLKKLNLRFAFAMDLHEIPYYWADEGWSTKDNPHTAYLYETQADRKKRLGAKMVQNLPKDIEVCDWPKIYGDTAEKGVVSYPEGNGNKVYAEGTTLDAYLFKYYTDHSFTTETPIGWPLEKRVRTHTSWLSIVLASYGVAP